MTRIIEPMGGYPVTIPITDPQESFLDVFPDLRRPNGKAMTLNVELSGGPAVNVFVELLQDQNQIGRGFVLLGSKKITVTDTPTNYVIPIAHPERAVVGRCHLSMLYVRITPPIRCGVCPAVDLPTMMVADDGEHQVTLDWNGSAWAGHGELVGCSATDVVMVCTGNVFYFAVGGAQYLGSPAGSCDPLSMSCTAFSHCDNQYHTVNLTQ